MDNMVDLQASFESIPSYTIQLYVLLRHRDDDAIALLSIVFCLLSLSVAMTRYFYLNKVNFGAEKLPSYFWFILAPTLSCDFIFRTSSVTLLLAADPLVPKMSQILWVFILCLSLVIIEGIFRLNSGLLTQPYIYRATLQLGSCSDVWVGLFLKSDNEI
eukprot:UN26417